MWSWQMRSSSSVVTPGFTCGATTWSTSAAMRPATRIFSISSGVLRVIAIRALSPTGGCYCTPRAGDVKSDGCASARRPRRASPANTHLLHYPVPGCLREGVRPRRQRGGPTPEPLPAGHARGSRPTLYGGRFHCLESSNAPDHHAPDAGSRRPLRPPDPLLEPEDGPVHLRCPRQDPHHQPREDGSAVQRRDELHLG